MQLTNDWYYFTAALSKETCNKIKKLGKGNFKNATVNTKKGITPEERIHGEKTESGIDKIARTSDVAWTNKQWVYNLIWPYMETANEKSGWKFDIKAAESMQITRYKKREFYNFHKDGKSDSISVYDQPNNKFLHGHVRKLSITVLLNDKYTGGEFQFAYYKNGNCEITTPNFTKTGSIIVFPSFIEHRVQPVTKGVRYSLVAWFVGPPFK